VSHCADLDIAAETALAIPTTQLLRKEKEKKKSAE
jgi:hypothetical protein